MIGLQAAAGVLLAFLAAIQVRPIFKRQDGAVPRPRGLRAILAGAGRMRSPSSARRPPMLSRSCTPAGPRGFARVVGLPLTLVLGGLLLYYASWYGLFMLPSWSGGTARQRAGRMGLLNNRARWEFFYFLKMVLPLLDPALHRDHRPARPPHR